MTRTTTSSTSMLVLVMLIACDRDSTPLADPIPAVQPQPTPAAEPTPEPEPTPSPEQLAAALVDTIEALGAVHAEHADDCPALAGAIAAFHAEHGAALASASAELHAHIDADTALRERVQAAMELVMSASMACREDPTFAATRATLFGAD